VSNPAAWIVGLAGLILFVLGKFERRRPRLRATGEVMCLLGCVYGVAAAWLALAPPA
jgi:hypothetical protein